MTKKRRYTNPISCIYKITYDKYIYIGSTAIFSKRKFEHLWMLKNNIHTNPILQNIYNKHGRTSIEISIVEEVPIENLIESEQRYIDQYKTSTDLRLINILLVAGSSLGYKQSQETCDKKRKSMLGKNKGVKRSEEYCLQQSIRQKNRVITQEWKDKISNTLKGRASPNKPKKFIIYNNITYSYKEFAEIVNCNLSNLYLTTQKYTEKKYGCKFLEIKQDSEVRQGTY